MSGDFPYDVFPRHSNGDKPVVRELAASLNKDCVRVWLDEEQIKPGDSIPTKIAEGPVHFGVRNTEYGFTQPGISAEAFGSDWAQLESGTCGRGNLPLRDPLSKEPRFLPLRLDDSTRISLAED